MTRKTSMTSRRGATALGLVFVLAGCNSAYEDSPFADWVEQSPPAWRLSQDGADHNARSLLAEPNPTGALNFSEDTSAQAYVQIALQRSPAIRAAAAKVDRLSERIPQVTSLDDPMLSITPIGELAETAEGQVSMMSRVSQKLPFPGKLDTKGRIAQQAVEIAMQELNDTRLRVIADTRRAYWSYYFTTRGIEVLERDRDLIRQFRDAAEAKYKANTATQQDVLRASVELSNLDNELLTLNQRQTTAVAMLNRLLDQPINTPLPEPKTVELDNVSLRLDRLLADAAVESPRLKKIHERIQMYRERLNLARLERWPDLTVSLSYNPVDSTGTAPSATGKDQWWLGFGVNLPIWLEKRDAAEREALKGMFQGIAELTGESNDIAFRIQDSLVKVETQQRQVILFRDVIIPQARQTVEASDSGYRAGKTDFLTLVDNWRNLLDFQLLYHQSLAQLEKDFADLQRVVGRDLDRTAHVIETVPNPHANEPTLEDGSDPHE
jgi:outer membrane protein, heavy metal efflux system